MKYLMTFLFLITLFAFLIFYNLKYVPLRDSFLRLYDENRMWQEEIGELKRKMGEGEKEKMSILLSWDDLFPKDEVFFLKEEGKEKLFSFISEAVKETSDVYIYNYGPTSLSPNLLKSYSSPWDFTWRKGKVIADYLILNGIPQKRLYLVIGLEKITSEGERLERVCEIFLK
ncbi:MAG: hypothetical protein ABIL00_04485 [candidate division WOR-3 bacterium]